MHCELALLCNSFTLGVMFKEIDCTGLLGSRSVASALAQLVVMERGKVVALPTRAEALSGGLTHWPETESLRSALLAAGAAAGTEVHTLVLADRLYAGIAVSRAEVMLEAARHAVADSRAVAVAGKPAGDTGVRVAKPVTAKSAKGGAL